MLNLIYLELKRNWLSIKRYPLEFIAGLAMLTVTFYLLVAGAHYMAGSAAQFGDRLDSVILAYFVWTIALFALSNTANEVTTDAITGTLEQVYLSPFGPLRVFLIRAFASIGLNLFVSLCMLGIMLLLTGRRLAFPPSIVLPLIPIVLSAYGVGIAIGGVALVFKKVASGIKLLQFGMLFVIVMPVETWQGAGRIGAYFIPIAPSAGLLRDLMVRGLELDQTRFLLCLLSGFGFFIYGVLHFIIGDRIARSRGTLGQY